MNNKLAGKKVKVAAIHLNDGVLFARGRTGVILTGENDSLPLNIKWDFSHDNFNGMFMETYWHEEEMVEHLRYMNNKPVVLE